MLHILLNGMILGLEGDDDEGLPSFFLKALKRSLVSGGIGGDDVPFDPACLMFTCLSSPSENLAWRCGEEEEDSNIENEPGFLGVKLTPLVPEKLRGLIFGVCGDCSTNSPVEENKFVLGLTC